VRQWREQGTAPEVIHGHFTGADNKSVDFPVFPYPLKTGWDAANAKFEAVDGPRGGVDRVADSCLPPAAE